MSGGRVQSGGGFIRCLIGERGGGSGISVPRGGRDRVELIVSNALKT